MDVQSTEKEKAYRNLHVQVSDKQLARAAAGLCSHGIQLGLCLSLLLSSLPSQVLFCLQRVLKLNHNSQSSI